MSWDCETTFPKKLLPKPVRKRSFVKATRKPKAPSWPTAASASLPPFDRHYWGAVTPLFFNYSPS